MKSIAVFVITCLLAFTAGLLHAAGPVSVNPATVQVNAAGSSTITISWRVGVTSRVPRSVTVSSPNAQLGTLGTIGGPLRQTVQHPGTGLVFFTVTERLNITRTAAARLTNAGTVALTRRFTDFAGTSPAAAVRVLTTSGGPLAVRDASLTFDRGSRFEVAPQNTPLTARLQITTSGRGLLDGAWEVSGPSDTSTGFRVVGRARQVLAGTRRITLESPALPVQRSGIYRVRFVPSPSAGRGIDLELPELRYSVTPISRPSDNEAVPSPQAPTIVQAWPASGATLSSATQFHWKPVQRAMRYRLEFFTQGAGYHQKQPVAAVDTSETSTQLKPFTRKRLFDALGNGAASWRITAFDASGVVLARSPLRNLTQTSAKQQVRKGTP